MVPRMKDRLGKVGSRHFNNLKVAKLTFGSADILKNLLRVKC